MSGPEPFSGWIRARLSPGGPSHVLFGYHDPHAGPSGRAAPIEYQPESMDPMTRGSFSSCTVRLAKLRDVERMTREEVNALGLPWIPDWAVGLPPLSLGEWRFDPRVREALHENEPDDVQANFLAPGREYGETMWVRLDAVNAEVDGYDGTLLNRPHRIPGLPEGARVTVRPVAGRRLPIGVDGVLARNLRDWRCSCRICDADADPRDLDAVLRQTFPDLPHERVVETAFTTRCWWCGGTMVVRSRGCPDDHPQLRALTRPTVGDRVRRWIRGRAPR